MSPRTLLQFLFGRKTAIQELGSNRLTLGIGFCLVLTAAVARNYDQTSILEKPWWPFGPVVFSAVSGLFVYIFVYWRFLRTPSEPQEQVGFWQSYPRFLALFWMTAPAAWLYAIPVERLLGTYPAAWANVGFLLSVSVWRVWLMSRILVVQLEVSMRAALRQVLLPASLELTLLSIFGGLSMLEVMGGLIHSPERRLIGNVIGVGFYGGFIGVAIALLMGIKLPKVHRRRWPELSRSRFPIWLLLLLAIWGAVAIGPQRELERNRRLEQLLQGGTYQAALEFLSAHERTDFSPSHRIAPDPYTYRVFDHLPKLFAAMKGTEPVWVRELYLDHLSIMLKHYTSGEAADAPALFEALARIPEGPSWVTAHKDSLSQYADGVARRMEPEQRIDFQKVLRPHDIELPSTIE